MPLISLEDDTRYRRDGDRFVEVCRACQRDLTGDRCACGAERVKPTSNRWVTSWKPTKLRPVMPPACPHCERPGDRLRSITLALPTNVRRSGGDTRITIEFRSCGRLPPPALSWLGFVTSMFFVVVFALALLFGRTPALVGLVLALLAAIASWRAFTWLRFARFDHRSIRLRARRRSYATAVADANGGRIL